MDTRRIRTRTTDDDNKPFPDSPGRGDLNSRASEPALTQAPHAGKHAGLTADTTIHINDGQSFGHNTVPSTPGPEIIHVGSLLQEGFRFPNGLKIAVGASGCQGFSRRRITTCHACSDHPAATF